MEQKEFIKVFDQYVCSIVASGMVSKFEGDEDANTWQEASMRALFLMIEREKVRNCIGGIPTGTDECSDQATEVFCEYDLGCVNNCE